MTIDPVKSSAPFWRFLRLACKSVGWETHNTMVEATGAFVFAIFS
jgi:hypothetical protein